MSVEKTRRSSWFVSLLTLLVILQTATPAWAWGRLGHRVIARLAEKRLTPEAKAAVAALLEPGESLADASLWADKNRGRLPKTAPWHFVDVPLDEPKYDAKFSGDVSSKGCVVAKINGASRGQAWFSVFARCGMKNYVWCPPNSGFPVKCPASKEDRCARDVRPIWIGRRRAAVPRRCCAVGWLVIGR
ncbi:MAG: S1/P1 nuclease [Isosphaeraceae bacterium]